VKTLFLPLAFFVGVRSRRSQPLASFAFRWPQAWVLTGKLGLPVLDWIQLARGQGAAPARALSRPLQMPADRGLPRLRPGTNRRSGAKPSVLDGPAHLSGPT
jgi:hypothetical protein